ncbi:MAG: methylated-DNA--[protein]-cysteine S-methyltransferase [Proteobacteria bacterium]|nr:methylated-DNA--[protein]-cysteine S-methyltransferase [Pseudomonadota bacterium]
MLTLDTFKIGDHSLSILCSDERVHAIFNDKNTSFLQNSVYTLQENKVSQEVKNQLNAYFNQKLTHFDLPISLKGTPFQTLVWEELLKIPYGKTVSYIDIARNIKRDAAVRAVGNANGKNPYLIVVPCHRVILQNGRLGGYSSGLDLKKQLLHLENAAFQRGLKEF